MPPFQLRLFLRSSFTLPETEPDEFACIYGLCELLTPAHCQTITKNNLASTELAYAYVRVRTRSSRIDLNDGRPLAHGSYRSPNRVIVRLGRTQSHGSSKRKIPRAATRFLEAP